MMFMTAKVNPKKIAIIIAAVVGVILALILLFGGNEFEIVVGGSGVQSCFLGIDQQNIHHVGKCVPICVFLLEIRHTVAQFQFFLTCQLPAGDTGKWGYGVTAS